MPIYEYACHDCGHAFEALVRSSTVPECPACHSQHLEKQLSVFATSSSESAQSTPLPPSSCGACPNANGPGGCGFGGMH
ncbi:MAG: zinc ribbon domain-containing protein [Simplicispira sp.]|jgi:putative FmdB family regulatory protein|uniref:FmdB family zinc ribbon protein n=1 Tax=Simplicispira sp. TaxID=2015802 RepID=UPI001B7C6640|nr:zinc ribbon domain-containing protein [Simplicispira sp.]MBP7413583.1 zinc ribbon domain-containing protein [Giesbergeria sp.]MBP8205103.1 zinc ribbon domain-containing protein [Giesbergeria sp.]MDD2692388.1 zinc ribbon domain-containing protein [Simplicispira sp.]